MTDVDWHSYVAAFHREKPGITERVLGRLDGSPYGWLAEPLHGTTGWIIDVACGSAPTRACLVDRRWVGVDFSANELAAAVAVGRRPVVRGRADALPFADGVADAVCAAIALQVVTSLPQVLAEILRVLRPGGLLAAVVPGRLGLSARAWMGWARVLGALRITGQPWPNPHAGDRLARVLSRHGFEVVSSDRRMFSYPVDTPESAALLIDSLYLPTTGPERIVTAKRMLGSWAGPGRVLPLPLRRVVARR